MSKSEQPSLVHTFDSPMPDFDGASILVTGGTGSFGKAFVHAVLQKFQPLKLIIFSRDELKQFDMQQDARFRDHDCLRYFIGDVRDSDRLELAFREIDIVVHAAALKQITTAEYNPIECIKTNVHGAENVVMAAIRSGVKKVMALSTDKAVNPANLYGASKLAADKIFIAANNLSGRGGTAFSVVRYGNVIDSRGSVVPHFRRLIEEGATSLPITDERMTRFWMTLDQGVHFVLSSISLMESGEIFVPKLPSMTVCDVALAMAPDLPHEVVGIRIGEKLHEVLITEADTRYTIEIDDRYVILPAALDGEAKVRGAWAGVTPIKDGSRYASDTNPDWLAVEQFRALLGTD